MQKQYVRSTPSSADKDDDGDNGSLYFISATSSAETTTMTMRMSLFETKASAAAEAVLDRNAFLDKPFSLAHDHWTHQQMLNSSRVPPDLRLAGFEPKKRGNECGLLDH